MSELIKKASGEPFGTLESAKAARTRMGEDGLDTNIVEVEGGYALETNRTQKRPKRVPVGVRNRLTVNKKDMEPGYTYRFVTDTEDRIRMCEDAGYEIVRDKVEVGDGNRIEDAKPIGSAVTKPVGRDQVGYLMRIKNEFYKEDQEAKINKIKENMKAIKEEPNKPGHYGKIKIRE